MPQYDTEVPFQRRLVAAAWKDGKALKDHEIYDPAFLTDEVLAGVLRSLQELQSASGQVPDLPAVIEAVRTQVAPGRKWSEYAKEAKLTWSKTKGDLAHYLRTAIDFARQQSVKAAIEEAHGLVQDGELDNIESIIRKALRVGGAGGTAVDYLATSADRFRAYVDSGGSDLAVRIPTGFGPLDAEIRGGVGIGELGLILGLQGTGKSHTLVSLGAHAFLTGRSVLHVSLENSREITETRYDSRIIGYPAEQLRLKPKTFRTKMEGFMSQLKSKLLVSFFPMKTLTLSKLEAHIESADPRPQLVLVDYAGELAPPARVDEMRLQLVALFSGLRGIAARTGTAIWTAAQANRPGMDSGLLDARHLAECFQIGGIVDYGISLNVKDDRPALADLYVWKNRNGKDCFIVKCERDWALSKLTPLLEA
jgi:hypothetical protein